MQNVVIAGPNLPGDASGMLHVHRIGCHDLLRPFYRGSQAEQWQMDAGSEREVVETIWEDIIAENGDTWESYTQEVKFFPCVHLPRESTPPCVQCGERPWGYGYCGELCNACADDGGKGE